MSRFLQDHFWFLNDHNFPPNAKHAKALKLGVVNKYWKI